jgi:hypothetical protein
VVEAEVKEPIEGDGYAVASIDGIGEGYGFRKIRRALGVTAFGITRWRCRPGTSRGGTSTTSRRRSTSSTAAGSSSSSATGRSTCSARAASRASTPPRVREMKNVGETDAVYVVAGGKDGYVGRDGRVPDDETSPRGPGFSGPAGAASS